MAQQRANQSGTGDFILGFYRGDVCRLECAGGSRLCAATRPLVSGGKSVCFCDGYSCVVLIIAPDKSASSGNLSYYFERAASG